MSISLSLFAGAGAQFFDNNGNPLTGGKIYTYSAGTTTPKATYTTNSDASLHTNPIVLDSSGRVPNGGEIWVQTGVGCKFVVKTSADVLIATYDNIPSSAQQPAANDADSIMYEQGYTVSAGSFVVGETYRIVTVGTTDFMAIGATSNSVGVHFIASGAGSGTGTAEFSQTVEFKLRQTVSVKDFGAVGDGVTDDTAAIQAVIDAVQADGGGTVILTSTGGEYITTDTLTVGDNIKLVFEQFVKLTVDSSNGSVLLLNGDNIEIVNPLIDGNNLTGGGENGIGVTGGNNIHVYGGKIKNCARGGAGSAFGGKGIQIEPGSVEGLLVDGVEFSYCFMAMSTIRDGLTVPANYGILFTNIKADNCEILFFVRQSNINDMENTVQLNNFYAVQCGAFEGVMQFSRAANVQVSNGIIVNSGSAITALIRGNHRYCRFDNIRFSGDCARIIDLDPSTFAVDSSYVCTDNTYDINYSGSCDYLAYADAATTNRILQNSYIKALLSSDVATKIVNDELRNGYCVLDVQIPQKSVLTTTATFYLEGRSTFASYGAGISVPRFNSSQITFPSTQIASTDPNTLDDYEEGTWTPTDNSGASLVFSTGYGNYVKIGKMVFASFAVTYPVTASGANTSIAGLPYVSQSTSGQITSGFAVRYTDQGAIVTALNNPGASTFALGNLSGTVLTNANMSSKTLQGTLIYQAGA